MNKVFGSMVASVVAGFVMSAPVLAEHENGKAHDAAAAKMACQNNTCKGKAACKGFGSDTCAGKNACKGHGTLKAKDEAACKKKGGTWAEAK